MKRQGELQPADFCHLPNFGDQALSGNPLTLSEWPHEVEKWYSLYTMLEFDEAKSKSNLEKHGIDFIQAQALWDDPDLLEVPTKTVDESRFLIIGMIESEHWSAVVTYRNESIRIISVRRSRAEEVELYESEEI